MTQVMYFIHLLFFIRALQCIDLKINGEVSFHIRISHLDYKSAPVQSLVDDGGVEIPGDEVETEEVRKIEEPRQNILGPVKDRLVTAAAMVECSYQYPEKEQVNAMLSYMMNQLTKRNQREMKNTSMQMNYHSYFEVMVFVRVHEYITEEDARRLETRFRVVGKKNTGFFEQIYNNMSQEYRQFYNSTVKRVDRATSDPCQHQDEIKHMWKELLEKSLVTLRRAATLCVVEYMKVQNRSTDTKIRIKLDQFLSQEMTQIKSSQLDVLCDKFQLCYNELL